MTRTLTQQEAASALRRGKQIEQLASLNDGVLTYLTAHQRGPDFIVRRHVVHDEGTDDFRGHQRVQCHRRR